MYRLTEGSRSWCGHSMTAYVACVAYVGCRVSWDPVSTKIIDKTCRIVVVLHWATFGSVDRFLRALYGGQNESSEDV